MTQETPTPGFWEVEHFGRYHVAIVSAEREVVCEIDCEDRVEQARTDANLLAARMRSMAAYARAAANFRLMASAPAMLAALIALVGNGFTDEELARRWSWDIGSIRAARAAIAKAEG